MLVPVVDSKDLDAEWINRLYAATTCLCVTFASFEDLTEFKFVYSGKKIVLDVSWCSVDQVDLICNLLNKGVYACIVHSLHYDRFVEQLQVPPERLIVQVDDYGQAQQLFDQGKSKNIQLQCISAMDIIANCNALLTSCPSLKLSLSTKVDDPFSSDNLEDLVGCMHKLGKDRPIDVYVHPIAPTSLVENPPLDRLSPARCLLQCLAKSDRPDNLIPTVVSDERGIALGLVYSNEESVKVAIGSGRGVYWSRSRGKLWRKGEESGSFQELISMQPDCDNDCLKVSVVQRGNPPAFCHKNERTCWGEDKGIPHLFRTLEGRKANPVPGSYTNRLFGDFNLLRDKILEEAKELSEALEDVKTQKGGVGHVEEETADVLYFALTACVDAGGSLLEVERNLDKRSLAVKRRKGDAKPQRQQEMEKLFSDMAEAKRLKESSSS